MKDKKDIISKLNKMDKNSLIKELETAKKEFSVFNLVKSVGKENNNSKNKIFKKNIARINTIISKVNNDQ